MQDDEETAPFESEAFKERDKELTEDYIRVYYRTD